MSHTALRVASLTAVLWFAAGPGNAEPPSPRASTLDEQARFLAGLPVEQDSPLAALSKTPAWKQHVAGLDKDWEQLSKRLGVMDAWVTTELRPRIQPELKVLYFFAGPDAIHVLRVYPEAPAYLLCGLEPVGGVSRPESMKPADLDHALEGLRSALRTAAPASFFRTSEMGHDLQGHEIRGVLPILFLFLARNGAHIQEAVRIEIDPSGIARDKPADEPWGTGVPGIRVRFLGAGRSKPQEMTYVRVDLANAALDAKPGFLAYSKTFAPGNSFLKAASFILFDKNFSKTRSFLVDNSMVVVQDDSGLPFRAFGKDEWEFVPFGQYLVPLAPFERNYQKPLAEVFASAPKRPLPFKIGYRKPSDSNLLLAIRRPPQAVPTKVPTP
jgi:hypothetical protein